MNAYLRMLREGEKREKISYVLILDRGKTLQIYESPKLAGRFLPIKVDMNDVILDKPDFRVSINGSEVVTERVTNYEAELFVEEAVKRTKNSRLFGTIDGLFDHSMEIDAARLRRTDDVV